MITKEDIERLGKEQVALGQITVAHVLNGEIDVGNYVLAVEKYKAAADEWIRVSKEFVKQQKDLET